MLKGILKNIYKTEKLTMKNPSLVKDNDNAAAATAIAIAATSTATSKLKFLLNHDSKTTVMLLT